MAIKINLDPRKTQSVWSKILRMRAKFFLLLLAAPLVATLPSNHAMASGSNRGAPDVGGGVGGVSIADSPSIPEVVMNEYMISNASRTPLLETYGATTCVIVTLWDPTTHTGALMHVSAIIDGRRSLDLIISRLRSGGVDPRNLQAKMIGGWLGWSEDIVKGLDSGLRDFGVSTISRDVLNPNVPPKHGTDLLGPITKDPSRGPALKNIIFDLRNGQTYDYQETVAPREGHHNADPQSGLLRPHASSL